MIKTMLEKRETIKKKLNIEKFDKFAEGKYDFTTYYMKVFPKYQKENSNYSEEFYDVYNFQE